VKFMNEGAKYWGVWCRACSEPVAFDTRPYHQFGLGSASVRPGAIRCGRGHSQIYYPRDFHFFASAVAITEETMQENRTTYIATNPYSQFSSGAPREISHREQPAVKEAVKVAVVVREPDEVPEDKARTKIPAPDAAREIARKAAKARWASWAVKKAM
jgi:hypothetical protein